MDGLRRRGGTTTTTFAFILRQKKQEMELSWRNALQRSRGNDVHGEVAEHLVPGERGGDIETGFQDEEGFLMTETFSDFTCWTRVVLVLAMATFLFNILVMIGVGILFSSVLGSILAVMVGLVQWKMEDLDSTCSKLCVYSCVCIIWVSHTAMLFLLSVRSS